MIQRAVTCFFTHPGGHKIHHILQVRADAFQRTLDVWVYRAIKVQIRRRRQQARRARSWNKRLTYFT